MTGVSVVYVVSIRTTQMERLNVMQQLDRFPTATIMWGSLNHDAELTEVGLRSAGHGGCWASQPDTSSGTAATAAVARLVIQGPDLQNILRQSYDNAKVSIDLR